MATVDDVPSDKVAVANVYDEIVRPRTLVAFDDLGEDLEKKGTGFENRENIGCFIVNWRTSREMYFGDMVREISSFRAPTESESHPRSLGSSHGQRSTKPKRPNSLVRFLSVAHHINPLCLIQPLSS
jgi:hypothetical protein